LGAKTARYETKNPLDIQQYLTANKKNM